jgi:hypothetical protein
MPTREALREPPDLREPTPTDANPRRPTRPTPTHATHPDLPRPTPTYPDLLQRQYVQTIARKLFPFQPASARHADLHVDGTRVVA